MSKGISGGFPTNEAPLSTSVQLNPSVLTLTMYLVTRWSWQQFLLERACMNTAITGTTKPKSICAHWLPSLLCADQAWSESSMERAWPVPMALLPHTEEYERDTSGGLLTLAEYSPALQLVQKLAAFAENMPATQAVHLLDCKYVPAAHSAQELAPSVSTPKRMEMWPDQLATFKRTKRASTGAEKAPVAFTSKYMAAGFPVNFLPPSTSFQLEPSVLTLTVYAVTRWSSQQFLFERA